MTSSARVYLDFETYSPVDLPKAGAYRYAEHPDTDILCMGYAVGDAPPCLWVPGEPFPPLLRLLLDQGFEFVIHNAEFDWNLWNAVAVPRYGFPPLPLDQVICTAAKASARALPRSLDAIAKYLGFPQKDTLGKAAMLTLSRPRAPTPDDPSTRYLPATHGAKFQVMYDYCLTDVDVCRRVDRRLRDLSPRETALWRATLRCNARGVPVDCHAIFQALAFIRAYSRRLSDECRQLTGALPSQTGKFLLWLHNNGALLENLQAATVEAALADPAINGAARKALAIRRQLSLSSLAKFTRMRDMVCADGSIKGNLIYHGAATGRFNGAGVQLLNLPQGNGNGSVNDIITCLDQGVLDALYDQPLDALKSAVRGMLKAPDGQAFLVADFSQIETRVLLWLAGETGALDAMRQGLDPYKIMASHLYNISYDDVSAKQRQLGKAMVLGCGFNQGAASFKRFCAASSIELSDDEAKAAVDAYRSKHPEVVSLWRACGKAAMTAITRPGRYLRCGKLLFYYTDSLLSMRLPSGRALHWNSPTLAPKTLAGKDVMTLYYMGVSATTRQWTQLDTYGGSIAQSAVQAIARDILGEAWLRVEEAGFSVVGAVHDELISLAPLAAPRMELFCQLMTEPPAWAPDLPLTIGECYAEQRYRK